MRPIFSLLLAVVFVTLSGCVVSSMDDAPPFEGAWERTGSTSNATVYIEVRDDAYIFYAAYKAPSCRYNTVRYNFTEQQGDTYTYFSRGDFLTSPGTTTTLTLQGDVLTRAFPGSQIRPETWRRTSIVPSDVPLCN